MDENLQDDIVEKIVLAKMNFLSRIFLFYYGLVGVLISTAIFHNFDQEFLGLQKIEKQQWWYFQLLLFSMLNFYTSRNFRQLLECIHILKPKHEKFSNIKFYIDKHEWHLNPLRNIRGYSIFFTFPLALPYVLFMNFQLGCQLNIFESQVTSIIFMTLCFLLLLISSSTIIGSISKIRIKLWGEKYRF